MTDQEWLECADPVQKFEFLRGKVSHRRLRLFNFACCRRIWEMLADQRLREAIVVSEKHADGLVRDHDFKQAMKDAHRACGKHNHAARAAYDAARYPGGPMSGVDEQIARVVAFFQVPSLPPTHRSYFVGDTLVSEECPLTAAHRAWDAAYAAERSAQADLFRDIIGPLPFHPVNLASSRLTPEIVGLAQSIYDYRAFNRLLNLADALEKNGCDNTDILAHCRGPGPHTKGCWVVDLILGKV